MSSSSSRSCCNTVIILVVRCVPTAAFENGSSSLYRGAGDPQAIRVWRIDGRSHSWEPATGWVFVGQSFCQFHWSWLARLAGFFSCRQVLLALAVPFPPVSLGQGEAVSSLSPLSEAGPLPCFRGGAFFSRGVSRLTLFAGLGRLFDVRRNVTSKKTHAVAHISMFSQSV